MSPIRKSEIRKKSRIFRKVYVSGAHTSAVQRAQEKLGVLSCSANWLESWIGGSVSAGPAGPARPPKPVPGWPAKFARPRAKVALAIFSPSATALQGGWGSPPKK